MKLTAILILVLLGSSATPAQAWEADVHYGLTLWLAIKAGFSPADAAAIAKADAALDDGTLMPATWAIGLHAMLIGDPNAFDRVRLTHFPCATDKPAPAINRRVYPDSQVALDLLRKTGPADLTALGERLHAFQDSWSHQGVPDSPTRPGPQIRPEMTWSHPKDRGGWCSHDADLTFNFVYDAERTAIRTYEVLAERTHTKVAFTFVPALVGFVTARTKEAKLAWVQQHESEFGGQIEEVRRRLATIDVPGRIDVGPQPDTRGPLLEWPEAREGVDAIRKKIDEFLDTWLRRLDIKRATSLVDIGAAGRRMGLGPAQPADEWVQRFLAMWLVRDHGLVNQLGHGSPTAAGYQQLPFGPVSQGPLSARIQSNAPLTSTIRSPSSATAPYALVRVTSAATPLYAAVFQFAGIPDDGIVLLIEPAGLSAAIVGLFCFVG